MRRHRAALAAAAFISVPLLAMPASADSAPSAVQAAVGDAGRPPADIALDKARNPLEVIGFAGIKTGDKVVDLMPGDGYYTRIMAKLVGPKGRVYGYVPITGTVEQEKARITAQLKPGEAPPPRPVDAVLAIQNIAEYHNVVTIWQMPWQIDTGEQFGLPEQVDAVFTASEYHDLHNMRRTPARPDPLNVGEFTKAIFRALKPGGTYVVIDHAAPKGAGFGATRTLHRTEAEAVKAEIIAAGFQFDGESNALANPADARDKPANTEAAYNSTDKFILRFKKPITATGDKRPAADPLAGFYSNTTISGKGTENERRVFYHSDNSYQEFGEHDMQSGTTFWNADGNSCMLHQFPADQRNFVVCHAREPHKVGDIWNSTNALGQTRENAVISGYHPLPEMKAAN